jgi:hypothetical protein
VTRTFEHAVEHRGREAPRERVLLARMERADDRQVATPNFQPVREARARTRQLDTA